jgi:hypothetical protein
MDAPSSHYMQKIGMWLERTFKARFTAGQEAHGGRFYRKPVWHELEAEAIDLVTYVYKVQDDRQEALRLLEKALMADGESSEMRDWVEMARNVLVYGNSDGTVEEERERRAIQINAEWDYTDGRKPGY